MCYEFTFELFDASNRRLERRPQDCDGISAIDFIDPHVPGQSRWTNFPRHGTTISIGHFCGMLPLLFKNHTQKSKKGKSGASDNYEGDWIDRSVFVYRCVDAARRMGKGGACEREKNLYVRLGL